MFLEQIDPPHIAAQRLTSDSFQIEAPASAADQSAPRRVG